MDDNQTSSNPPWYKAHDFLKFLLTAFSLITVYTGLYSSYINTLNKIAQLELKIDQLHFELTLSEKEKLLLTTDAHLLRHQIDSLKLIVRNSPKKDLFPPVSSLPPNHESGSSVSSEPAKSPPLGTIQITWPENFTEVEILLDDKNHGVNPIISNLPYGEYKITLKRGLRTASKITILKNSVDTVKFSGGDFN